LELLRHYFSDVYIRQVGENPEHFEKPDDHNNDDDDVQDGFNLAVHGDVCVDQPENNTRKDQYDKYG
jgi:hypothetical protein